MPVVYKDYKLKPYYAEIYRNHYWVPIIEKAIAKAMGSYTHLEDKHPVNGLRMISGVPVFNVNFGNDCDEIGKCGITKTADIPAVDKFSFGGVMYNHIAASVYIDIQQHLIDNQFPITATTRNTLVKNNLSGLAVSTTYTVLSATTLLDMKKISSFGVSPQVFPNGGDATSKGQVFVIRDSKGTNTYSGALINPLNPGSAYWTDAPAYAGMAEQISNYQQYIAGNDQEIEGDKGIFLMTSSEFFNAFQSYQVAHDQRKHSYQSTWFDVENDTGVEKEFFVTVPAQADLLYYLTEDDNFELTVKEYGNIYFQVESYF